MIDLYLGDCLEILPTIPAVDTVITDPIWPNVPEGMFPDVNDPKKLLADALSLIDARRLIVIMRGDSDPRFLEAVPNKWDFFRAQILSYVIPGYIGRKLGGDEIAYCFGEPLPSAPGRRLIPGRSPKAQPKNRSENGHPCSRAQIHLDWLVHWWSLPGELVLDPFMGSCTTGIACVKLQREFIGIEIDPVYYEIAEINIKEAQKQLLLPLDWKDD